MEKLIEGKSYKIGKYDKCRIGGRYFLCLDDIENTNIYTQFGITKEDIYKILGYTPLGQFPTCKTLEDLQKVYEYIMSKDPNNKKTIKVEDLKYPDQIHITSKEQYDRIKKYYNKLDLYSVEFKYYLANCSGKNEIPFTGTPASIAKTDRYNLYEFEDIIFPEKKQEDKFIVGKWYVYSDCYLKFSHKQGERYYGECIKTNKTFDKDWFWVAPEHIKNCVIVTDLSIIQPYLPEGHVDKILVKKSLVFKKGIWYKYHSARFYIHCSKDAIDTLFYDKYIEVSTGYVGEDTSSYSNKYITNEEVPLSEIEKYIPKENMKEQVNFIHGEYYVDRVNSGGSRIFKYDKPNYQLYYINTAVKCFFINNYDSSLEKDSVPATQKEIDWLNKCIKANRFVSEDYFVELTSLPEKWCVKPRTSKEADEIFTYKGIKKYSDSRSLEYYQHYPAFSSCCTASSTIQDGYTEITYEQFKKWVMKEEEPDMEEILRQAKEKYPIGSRVKDLNFNNCTINSNWEIKENSIFNNSYKICEII